MNSIRPTAWQSARPSPAAIARLALLWGLAAGLPGCGAEREGGAPPLPSPPGPGETLEANAETPQRLLSPDAKVETHEMLQADMAAPRHPSDGGGRAWLVGMDERPSYRIASRQRFEILYEVGPLGIAEGGVIVLQPPPFWDWDPPQASHPDAPGFTLVSSEAEGVVLEVDERMRDYLALRVTGRALSSGERIRFVYGAGEAGARTDGYAEHDAEIYLAVDGDGDGVRALVAELPIVDIHAAPPSLLQLTLPTTARPGERILLTLAALDHRGNASDVEDGEVEFIEAPEGLQGLPAKLSLSAPHGGRRSIEIVARDPGVYRLRVSGSGELVGLVAESNPLLVREALPHLLWGDLHGHSQLSDGTGTPDDYYDYARNVAALDVSALTDHDHWGMRFLDSDPAIWEKIRSSVARFDEPGRFVALLGYEWTSWLHGHRHVLYFDDEGEVYSSLDPRYETPRQLWDALDGQLALTFAHHSAGGPIATNWYYPPDPVLEPVTEIASVHGSSEAMDTPNRIHNPIPGNFVRDVLVAGYRLGFIGSGDSHDGHPGLVQVAMASRGGGGLAAIQSEERTRQGVLAALRARRVYATNGPRIFLAVSLDGHPMGSLLPPASPWPHADSDDWLLEIEVVASAPIERVDIVRSDHTASIAGEGRLALSHQRRIPPLAPGEFHYVRVLQEDGGAAWSSPFFAQ